MTPDITMPFAYGNNDLHSRSTLYNNRKPKSGQVSESFSEIPPNLLFASFGYAFSL